MVVSGLFGANAQLGDQKRHLKHFLTVLESSNASRKLDRELESLDSKNISEDRFRELCRQVRESVTDLPYEDIYKLSQNIIDAVKMGANDNFNMLWKALEFVQENLSHVERNTRSVSRKNSDDPQTRILISSVDAFDWPYDGQQALAAFIEYLDVQWVNMREHYNDSKGTLQSRCGTIIQSSYTGKSRLVHEFAPKVISDKLIYRLGEKILVPNVNFQSCTDTGMSQGFPHRVSFQIFQN